MNTDNTFMIQKVEYDNFDNKLITILTNKNLAKELITNGPANLSNTSFLSNLDGEERWVTHAEITIGIKGNFKIRKYECYSYDGRKLSHPLSSITTN